jgi:hypothetical protein
MSPERTARTIADDFSRHLEGVRAEFHEAATAEGGQGADAYAREYSDYSAGYEQRCRAWLAARGRTASSMVTGSSNFPTRRNAKALDTERRRLEELFSWAERAQKRALKALRPPPDYATQIAEQEELLETMKEANKIIRKKWPDERKVAALRADLGWREETARKVLEPDVMGRIGFPSDSLLSIRRKIKRLKKRVAR